MPFCPKCRYEYKEGIEICSDCKVPLVEELSNEEPEADFYMDTRLSEEEISDLRKVSEPAAKYVSPLDRAENYKSGAGVLISVGALGLLALVFINVGIIKISLPGFTSTMVNLVMGALFVIFLVMGVNSFLSYKKLAVLAEDEDTLEKEIYDWCDNKLDKAILDAAVSENDADEIKFFNRTEALRSQLKESYPDLEEGFMEHMVEDLYDRIFG